MRDGLKKRNGALQHHQLPVIGLLTRLFSKKAEKVQHLSTSKHTTSADFQVASTSGVGSQLISAAPVMPVGAEAAERQRPRRPGGCTARRRAGVSAAVVVGLIVSVRVRTTAVR
jgi:hypothetical protein